MKTAKFTVTGIRSIDKKLAKAPKKARKLVSKTQREIMKPIQKDAKTRSPRDSGELKKNIKVRAGKKSRTSVSMNVVVTKGEFGDRFPAAFQEYGTSKTQKQPFMRPAWDTNKNGMKKRFIKTFGKVFIDEMKKGKGKK